MQRLVALLRRVRERPPPGSAPAPGAAGASELREKGWGELHSAAASGDLARLRRRWWWKRLRINWRDAKKQTPLHLACANGHTDVVRFLVEKKCHLNPRDSFKKSPLMKAVEHQHKDCATLLLEHGANPDLRAAGGNTALHLAAIIHSKSLAELLLEHNAHIDAQNELGYTPLTLAITEHCEEMVEFLLQKGADVHARDNHERWVRQLQQELADALKKNALAEASPEAKKRYSRDLQEQKLQLQKELDRSKAKLQELKERRIRTECYVTSLKNAIKDKQRELTTSRNQQGLLVAYSRTTAVAELKERIRRLQVENARLEATVQQQATTIEALQKDLQASASLQELKERRIRTECYVTSLKNAIKDKQRELTTSRNQQGLLVAYSRTTAVAELKERIRRLQVENARLEATVQQQATTIEALQKDLQASASTSREVETSGSASDSHAVEAFGTFGCGLSSRSGGAQRFILEA
ncbi:PREDICTED: ankyrin repeat domain-containing protein 18B-like [Nipponia nippon]|uniref:ankyrin repeat domain-containing protein 18B-like n=1 Tax=Nipponia nippon TaxID=128390 RepID=UPI000510E36D|nr:PREDICTED: ankyrin repeat domain-containing protein 18B-like [Nipponia nippon]